MEFCPSRAAKSEMHTCSAATVASSAAMYATTSGANPTGRTASGSDGSSLMGGAYDTPSLPATMHARPPERLRIPKSHPTAAQLLELIVVARVPLRGSM